MIIKTGEFSDENFRSNPSDRCYHCKKELFSRLVDIAKKQGIKYVADGSNVSDLSDFRPGAKAAAEYGVMSPLRDAGFTKDEIRELSKELKLPTWNKPQLACLASRVPYGTRITKEILEHVGKGERYLKSLGLKQVRVRHHGCLARIEVDKCDVVSLLEDGVADMIDKKFRKLGYDVRVNLILKASGISRDPLRESLMKNPSVNSMSRVNNGFDFLVEAVFPSLRELDLFMEKIRPLTQEIKEFYVLEDLKKEAFMTDPLFMNQ